MCTKNKGTHKFTIAYDPDLAPDILNYATHGYPHGDMNAILAHELGHAYDNAYGPGKGENAAMAAENTQEPAMQPRQMGGGSDAQSGGDISY